MMYSLERLRSLLTFDQISFFLIAERFLYGYQKILQSKYDCQSLFGKVFEIFQCNAIECYIQEFRYREKHKKMRKLFIKNKNTPHFLRTPAYRSFTFRPV